MYRLYIEYLSSQRPQHSYVFQHRIKTWGKITYIPCDLKPAVEERELVPRWRGTGRPPSPLLYRNPVITPPPTSSLKIPEQYKVRVRPEAWRLHGIHFTRFVNGLNTQRSNGTQDQNSISGRLTKDWVPVWRFKFYWCPVLHLIDYLRLQTYLLVEFTKYPNPFHVICGTIGPKLFLETTDLGNKYFVIWTDDLSEVQ